LNVAAVLSGNRNFEARIHQKIKSDHISAAGAIAEAYPAGQHLVSLGVTPADFNSYGARRGNHEVMIRGTLGNIRLKNLLAGGKQGSYTRKFPENKLDLDGTETFTIEGLAGIGPRQKLTVKAVRTDGSKTRFPVRARLDTDVEVDYFRNGGILPYVLRKISR
jgi:aconitase A